VAVPGPPVRRTVAVSEALPPARRPRKREVRTGPPPLSGPAVGLAGLLLLIGVAVSVGGLFPAYLRGGGALSAGTAEILLHVVPLVAWATGGGLLLAAVALIRREDARPPRRPSTAARRAGVERPGAVRAGVALAGGSVWIVTGLDLGALAQLQTTGFAAARLGFWLVIAGNAVALVGCALGWAALKRAGQLGATVPSRAAGRVIGPLVAVAAVATVAGYTRSWRSFTVRAATFKAPEHFAVPGPFSYPGGVIAAQIVVVVGLGLLPLMASSWDQRRAAGCALLGVAVGLAGLVAFNVDTVVALDPRSLFEESIIRSYKLKVTASFGWGFWLSVAGLALLGGIGSTWALWRQAPRPDAVKQG
jgi:hypothetical protein